MRRGWLVQSFDARIGFAVEDETQALVVKFAYPSHHHDGGEDVADDAKTLAVGLARPRAIYDIDAFTRRTSRGHERP